MAVEHSQTPRRQHEETRSRKQDLHDADRQRAHLALEPGRDEIDDKNLVGLSGVVKITHSIVNGTSLLNLDGFAPRSQWEELAVGVEDQLQRTKAAS